MTSKDNMTDLQKAKIDLLRDALSDTAFTIRALDRKAYYYFGIFNFILILVVTYVKIGLTEVNSIGVLLFIFLLLFFLYALWNIVQIFVPLKNPNEIFGCTSPLSTFFIPIVITKSLQKAKKIDILETIEKFEATINSYEKVVHQYHEEIIKLSYIRDRKIFYINKVTNLIFPSIVYAILLFLFIVSEKWTYQIILLLLTVVYITFLLKWKN